jgi:GntR family transcriptional regulator
MIMLKRKQSLTDQAKAHIKQRILNDEFDGDRIPSETDLADQLGVSRTTIRDALSRLEIEGAIFRKQGSGTFVNKAGLRIKSRLEEIWGYESVLQDHGYTPSTQILGVRKEQAGQEIAADLNLSASDDLLIVQKLFFAEGEPVILTINHLPMGIMVLPYSESDLRLPIYRFLQEFGRQHLAYYLSEIVPTVASSALFEALRIPLGTALISFEEIGYNQDNVPVLKSFSYFRDDLLRLRLIRREAP